MYKDLFEKAKLNERKRLNLPEGISEIKGKRVFKMLDVILPESVILPHKQVTTGVIEKLTCIYGEVFVVYLNEKGKIIKVFYLDSRKKDNITIPLGVYHSIVAISPVVLKEEMGQPKTSLYDSKKDKIFAQWGKDVMRNVNESIRRFYAIGLYAKKPWEKFLSRFKFWEEPYEVVDRMLPDRGVITELGCGEGLLCNYLAIAKPQRKIIGIELVSQRMKLAEKGIKNTSYKVGDVVKTPFKKADAFILFHVLHHLPGKKAQEKVLLKAKNALNKGGKLIIVDVHVTFTLKYLAAWVADHFLVPWVFEKRFFTRAYFRTEREWKKTLNNLGFRVKTRVETRGRPFPNIVFECNLP